MAGPNVKITIAGDSRSAQKAAKDTTGAFGKMGAALKQHAGAIAAAVSVGAIAKFGESSVKTFESVVGQVRGLSKVTGDSATSMSQLRFAAQQTGVDTDTLTNSLRLASKQVVAGKSAFVANGIAVKDGAGHFRDMNAILGDTAAKFASMPNGPQKTALAMKLFGKSGAAMIPLLNQGKEGLLKFEGEASKFGEVIGDKQVAMIKKNVEAHRRMHAAWEGFQVQLGARIFPIVATITSWFAQRLPGALNAVSGVIGRVFHDIGQGINFLIGGWVGIDKQFRGNGIVGVLENLGATARTVFDALRAQVPRVQEAFHQLVGILERVGKWMMANKPTVLAFVAALGAMMIINEVVGAVMALNAALALNPFVLVAVALAALVAGIVYAYIHFQRFRDIVDAVGRFLRDNVLPAVQAAMRGIVVAAQAVVSWFRANWDSIRAQTLRVFNDVANIVRVYITIVRTQIQVEVGIILAIWRTFHSQILAVLRAAWNQIRGEVQGAIMIVRGIIRTVTALIHGDWGQAWNGIKQIFAGVWTAMRAIVSADLALIKAAISAAWTVVKAVTVAAWNAVKSAVSTGIGAVVALIRSLPSKASGALASIGSALVSRGAQLINGLKSGITSAWTSVASFLSSIPSKAVSAIGNVGSRLASVGSSLVHGIADGIRNAAGAVEAAIHSIGISWGAKKVLGVTVVPGGSIHLADGGIARRRPGGIMANIAEGRYDEAVVPLSPRNLQAMSSGGGQSAPPTVNVFLDGRLISDAVHQNLQAKQSRVGTLQLTGPKYRLAS